jgi:hypothetical protein
LTEQNQGLEGRKNAATTVTDLSCEQKSSFISWPGVYLGPLFPPNGITSVNLEHTQGDMTAIISAFTSEGFAIGADGRSLGKDQKVICEHSQKIFNFKRQHLDVVYAWCGETHVVNERDEVLYDLTTITREALNSAVQIAGRNFSFFVQQCCEGILNNIIKTPIVRKVTNSDSAPMESKARMLLNGYFDRAPFMVEFYIRDTDRIRVQAEKVHMPIPVPTRNFFSGCEEQNEKYAKILPTTAEGALKLVSDYIQDCIDNLNCPVVGGYRHIAYLDLNGFYWVDEPKKVIP